MGANCEGGPEEHAAEVSGPERNSGLAEVGANPAQTEEGRKPEQ